MSLSKMMWKGKMLQKDFGVTTAVDGMMPSTVLGDPRFMLPLLLPSSPPSLPPPARTSSSGEGLRNELRLLLGVSPEMMTWKMAKYCLPASSRSSSPVFTSSDVTVALNSCCPTARSSPAQEKPTLVYCVINLHKIFNSNATVAVNCL